LNNQTALSIAIKSKNQRIISKMLISGADANKTLRGKPMLHWAIEQGSADTVALLLQHGAEILERSLETPKQTALLRAVELGNPDIIETLLDWSNGSNHDGQLWSAKMDSTTSSQAYRASLKNEAPLEAKDSFGITPLLAAARRSANTLRILLQAGAGLGAKDNLCQTALRHAAMQGQDEVVEILLQMGSDVSAKTQGGHTPLHVAAYKGSCSIVRALLDNGADVNAKDNNNQTALHQAAKGGRVGVVKVLLKQNADINATDKRGDTALLIAKENEDLMVAKALLDEGAVAPLQGSREVIRRQYSTLNLSGLRDADASQRFLSIAKARDFIRPVDVGNSSRISRVMEESTNSEKGDPEEDVLTWLSNDIKGGG
jgi:ankyrin repeat protein